MAVPYTFANTPGGASISLSELDANFAYLENTSVITNDLDIGGNLTVGGTVTFGGVTATGVTGTVNLVYSNSPTLVTPNLGTPSAITLTNATGLPLSGISGLGTGVSASLSNPVNNSGGLVGYSGILGTPVAGNLINCTNVSLTAGVTGILPVANGGTGVSALGTGVVAALGINIGTVGAVVAQNGALGTPSSATLTNATGLPLTTGVTGILSLANGGTGANSQQSAMNSLAGSVASGQYLRGNGISVVMSQIQPGDVPVLNQNTTGSAATFTSTTQNSQFNSIGVGQAADGVAGDIVATGKISDGAGTLRPMIVVQTVAASGTAVSFTDIPNWARRITVNFGDIVTSGTSDIQIQFSTSGGLVTSGYYSVANDGAASTSITSGYAVTAAAGALGSNNGSITFNFASDIPASATSGYWMQSGIITNSDATNKTTPSAGSAYFTLPVTGLKITTIGGTDTFTVGVIGITYE